MILKQNKSRCPTFRPGGAWEVVSPTLLTEARVEDVISTVPDLNDTSAGWRRAQRPGPFTSVAAQQRNVVSQMSATQSQGLSRLSHYGTVSLCWTQVASYVLLVKLFHAPAAAHQEVEGQRLPCHAFLEHSGVVWIAYVRLKRGSSGSEGLSALRSLGG